MAVTDMSKMGEKIIVGGLFVQLFFFSCFIIISGIFHHRMRVAPTHKSLGSSVRWLTYLITFYVTGVLIWVRSLFRVVEFIEGNDGHLMHGMLMLLVAWYWSG